MNYRSDIPYLYGKLNKELELATYEGLKTDTTETTVDNTDMTIAVDVKVKAIEDMIKTFLQNNSIILDANKE